MKRLFTLTICLLSLQLVHAKIFTEGFVNFKGFPGDTAALPIINQPVTVNLSGSIYERRLDSIQKDIPLDYNEYVQGYIDLYMRDRDEMARVLGLTKYYFPIYEKAFRDAGIPDEIKYLSIVESKLDPNAISRVGATGPWQFMATTGKTYGLNIDTYIDERRDPIQSTYAAAAYLKDAYQQFGDWLLAIASYNCGKSNVEHAVEKAGGATDFWSIRQYLPVETRGYVPAFIAMNYVMNYAKRHNITEQACNFSIHTDTVLVKRSVSLSNIAISLGVNLQEMTTLNPSYRMMVVNGTAKTPRRLIIPQTAKENYAGLYSVLEGNAPVAPVVKAVVNTNVVASVPQQAHPATTATANASSSSKADSRIPTHHTVKKGETLAYIADVFGIEVSDLKNWNHLKTNHAVPGTILKVSANADVAAVETQDNSVFTKN